MKRLLKNGLAVLMILVTAVSLVGCRNNKLASENVKVPWEQGGKAPIEYTWEEFQKLSGPQQIKFQNSFETEKEFEMWLDKVHGFNEEIPWENGGKSPDEYTWSEFLALSGYLQIQFQNSFENSEDFENWMNKAQESDTSNLGE